MKNHNNHCNSNGKNITCFASRRRSCNGIENIINMLCIAMGACFAVVDTRAVIGMDSYRNDCILPLHC